MSKSTLDLVVRLKALDNLSKPLQKATNLSKSATDRLRALEQQQKKIDGFKKLTSELNQSNAAMEKAREKTRHLQEQLFAIEKPSKNLQNAFVKSKRELTRLTSVQQNHNQRLNEMRNKMTQAGIPVNNLNAYERKLGNTITSVNAKMKSRQAQLDKLAAKEAKMANLREKHGKSMQHTGMVGAYGMGGLSVVRRGFTGAASMLAPGLDFGSAMSEVQALARLDKNSPQMKALRDQAKSLGESTSFTAADAARGQAFLAMAGWTPESILAGMPAILDMAAAGGTELAATADIASNIMGAFKIPANEMSRVADVLTHAFTSSNTNLEMLGQTMKYVGPVAAKAGMDLETTAAMAGLLGNIGIQGDMAGTQLREMLNRLTNAGGPAQKALGELGINVADKDGDIRNIVELIGDVGKSLEGMGSAQRLSYLQKIFGVRAGTGMSELIDQQGLGALDEYIKGFKEVDGITKKVADTKLDNLSGDLVKMSSAWQGLGIGLSEILDTLLRATTKELTSLVQWVNRFINRYPGVTKTILVSVAVFAALIGALFSLMIAYAAIMGPIKLVIFAMKLLSITTALTAAPIYLILLAIALLAAAAYLVYTNWEPISAFFKQLWDDTASYWTKAFNDLLTWFSTLPDKFSGMGTAMVNGLLEGLKSTFPRLAKWMEGLGEIMPGWLKKALGIHSPSRVFADIGVHTMDGLAKGLEHQAPIDTLHKLKTRVQQIGQGIVISTAAAGVGAAPLNLAPAAAGASYHIEIHAASGQSEERLAHLIVQKIQQHERLKSTKARASLLDRS